MLTVTGKIVSKKIKEIKFIDKKTGEQKEFEQHTAFIVSDGDDPIRIQSYEPITAEIDEEIDLPVYVKPYAGNGGQAGYNLIVLNN